MPEGWELFSLAKQRLEKIRLLSINWFGLNIRERTELFRLKESVGTRSGSDRLWICLSWNLEKFSNHSCEAHLIGERRTKTKGTFMLKFKKALKVSRLLKRVRDQDEKGEEHCLHFTFLIMFLCKPLLSIQWSDCTVCPRSCILLANLRHADVQMQ